MTFPTGRRCAPRRLRRSDILVRARRARRRHERRHAACIRDIVCGCAAERGSTGAVRRRRAQCGGSGATLCGLPQQCGGGPREGDARAAFPSSRRSWARNSSPRWRGVFVREQPPRSPLLAIYGDEFADFIAAFEPARELPYLADVARLEAARTRAYHAADATPLDAGRLRGARRRLTLGRHPHRSAPLGRNRSLAVSDRHDLGDEQRRAGACAHRGLARRGRAGRPGRISTSKSAACRRAARPSCCARRRSAARRGGRRPRSPTIRTFDLTGNLAGLIGSGLARDIVPQPSCQPHHDRALARRCALRHLRPARIVQRIDRRAGSHSLLAASRSRRGSFRPRCSGNPARPRSRAGISSPARSRCSRTNISCR